MSPGKTSISSHKPALLLALAALLAAPLTGEEEAQNSEIINITLQNALDMAQKSNRTLQKNAIDLAVAKRARDNLWTQVLSGISLGANASYGSIGIVKAANDGNAEISWGLSAGLSLQLSASLGASMNLIKLAYQSGLLEYETGKRQLDLTVTKAFYMLLAEEQNLAILRERRTQAEREAAQARVSYANGLMNEVNYSRSQLSARQAQYELGRAESAYSQNFDSFLLSLGEEDKAASGAQHFRLEGTITVHRHEPDAAALISQFLPSRPDIAAAHQAVKNAELRYTVQNMDGKIPSLTLRGSYSGKPANDFSDYTDGLSFSLALSVPLESWIPGSTANQNKLSALSNVEKARLDLADAEQEARRVIRSLCETLRTSWQNIEIANQSVELARRAYEMSSRAFREGAADFLTLENDRTALASSRQNLLMEQLNYKLAVLDLAQALNVDAAEFFGEE
ncbi:MAG: TolC family protein [Spirochaetaceae bacterium]|jgi:multidrug efflux system outer membrane protein|nr:TolC family protein [Spirochaetaceae bacterium]